MTLIQFIALRQRNRPEMDIRADLAAQHEIAMWQKRVTMPLVEVTDIDEITLTDDCNL